LELRRFCMTDTAVQSVPKTVPDITEEQIEGLKWMFPECVTEDGDGAAIDLDLLRAMLGKAGALPDGDTYTFTWAGKEDAFRAIQTPSAASLEPAPEESVNWDDTRHLFIEGENLEVLKLLYKSYFGKVKMIYIDPPYNTGNDFIYRDDYSEPRRAYLEKTGQMDAEGNMLTSNPETSGRYHSDWLTMMYPRLFLARQLLRDDGVIFVSIDDNEVYHLRLLMNEIFGEENWLGTFVWKSRQMVDNRTKTGVSVDHEYVLCYGRSEISTLRGSEKDLSKFSNPDDDPRGPWRSADMTGLATKDRRPNLHYELEDPATGVIYPCPPKGWRYDRDTMRKKITEGRVLFPDDPEGRPRHKLFLNEMSSRYTGFSTISTDIHTTHGTKDMLALFDEAVIQFPKPVELMKRFIEQATVEQDIILDFFAGSGTTAQGVLEFNRQDGESRRFVLVQFSEPVPDDSPALELGLETIAEVGKERIRRVIARMQEGDENGQLSLDLHPAEDLGFKVFKLAPSTFRQWEPPENDRAEALEEQLSLFDRGLEEDADPLHVIYEVILKLGYGLNATIEQVDLESNRVYRVREEEGPNKSGSSLFFVCIDDDLRDETIDALPLDEETTFVCLDTALDDSQKVNLAMTCLLRVI
jgi:adenine-specific DNA-methyltransferase